MRVLFVTNRYPTADTPGDSPCIAEQQTALQALGHQVDVLVIPRGHARTKYLRAMGRVFFAAQIRGRYDVIHAHYGYCGVVARMQFRCPVVVTFRGSDVYVPSELVLGRFVARCVEQTVVMTQDMKRLLGRDDIAVIPYGIDTDLFKPQDRDQARRELGLPLASPLVVFPYDPQRKLKRFDLVEQAAERLKPDFPDLRVLTLYDRAHEEVARYMNACDALVLASDTEGAPVAVREAMACNLPIVSVDVGDVAEVIRDTEGCHLAERNPDDLAQKLAGVLRARRRTNGRLAAQKWSIAYSAAQIAALYARLVRDGETARAGPSLAGVGPAVSRRDPPLEDSRNRL
jgi:teichuronic acid biosynthesis glycosyltransferase TuaC